MEMLTIFITILFAFISCVSQPIQGNFNEAVISSLILDRTVKLDEAEPQNIAPAVDLKRCSELEDKFAALEKEHVTLLERLSAVEANASFFEATARVARNEQKLAQLSHENCQLQAEVTISDLKEQLRSTKEDLQASKRTILSLTREVAAFQEKSEQISVRAILPSVPAKITDENCSVDSASTTCREVSGSASNPDLPSQQPPPTAISNDTAHALGPSSAWSLSEIWVIVKSWLHQTLVDYFPDYDDQLQLTLAWLLEFYHKYLEDFFEDYIFPVYDFIEGTIHFTLYYTMTYYDSEDLGVRMMLSLQELQKCFSQKNLEHVTAISAQSFSSNMLLQEVVTSEWAAGCLVIGCVSLLLFRRVRKFLLGLFSLAILAALSPLLFVALICATSMQFLGVGKKMKLVKKQSQAAKESKFTTDLPENAAKQDTADDDQFMDMHVQTSSKTTVYRKGDAELRKPPILAPGGENLVLKGINNQRLREDASAEPAGSHLTRAKGPEKYESSEVNPNVSNLMENLAKFRKKSGATNKSTSKKSSGIAAAQESPTEPVRTFVPDPDHDDHWRPGLTVSMFPSDSSSGAKADSQSSSKDDSIAVTTRSNDIASDPVVAEPTKRPKRTMTTTTINNYSSVSAQGRGRSRVNAESASLQSSPDLFDSAPATTTTHVLRSAPASASNTFVIDVTSPAKAPLPIEEAKKLTPKSVKKVDRKDAVDQNRIAADFNALVTPDKSPLVDLTEIYDNGQRSGPRGEINLMPLRKVFGGMQRRSSDEQQSIQVIHNEFANMISPDLKSSGASALSLNTPYAEDLEAMDVFYESWDDADYTDEDNRLFQHLEASETDPERAKSPAIRELYESDGLRYSSSEGNLATAAQLLDELNSFSSQVPNNGALEYENPADQANKSKNGRSGDHYVFTENDNQQTTGQDSVEQQERSPNLDYSDFDDSRHIGISGYQDDELNYDTPAKFQNSVFSAKGRLFDMDDGEGFDLPSAENSFASPENLATARQTAMGFFDTPFKRDFHGEGNDPPSSPPPQ